MRKKRLIALFLCTIMVGMLLNLRLKASTPHSYNFNLNTEANTIDLTILDNRKSNTFFNIKLDHDVDDSKVQEIEGLYVSISNSYLQVLVPENVNTKSISIRLN